jgi:thiol-disulfide isomerase/thioredoxin
MKSILMLSCLLCLLDFAARAELPLGWSTNYPVTQAEVAAKQEPMLVYFTASWCGPCKLMSQVILADPVIRQALAGTEHVAVDIDQNNPLAATFGVTAVPTFLLLSANGDETRRATGLQPAGDFLQWLTNGLAEARQAAIQLAQIKTELADIDRALATTNLAAMAPLTPRLFDLCAANDPAIVLSAGKRLAELTALNPAMVLPGLDCQRLATRLQVANALRARLGNAFDIDPWSDETTRKQAVEKWRQRLASAEK